MEKLRAIFVVTGLAILCAGSTRASLLSDGTGINIDVSRGTVTVGTPQPLGALQQIPGELQRFPQTVANLANPAGLALAAAIRNSNAQARHSCRPAPADIYQTIGAFFPGVIQAVCYTTADSGRVALDTGVMILNRDVVAI